MNHPIVSPRVEYSKNYYTIETEHYRLLRNCRGKCKKEQKTRTRDKQHEGARVGIFALKMATFESRDVELVPEIPET